MGQLAQKAESRQLVNHNDPFGLAEQMRFAQVLATSTLVPAAYRNKPADILVAIGLGQSMGLNPMQSLYGIHVIQGTPTASAMLIANAVRRAGHKLRKIEDANAQSVTVEIVRADDPDHPFRVTRDIAWAKRMGLAGKDNYQKQPMTMLYWRAVTACAREACPEAFFGVAYTPDEMSLDATIVPEKTQERDMQTADQTIVKEETSHEQQH